MDVVRWTEERTQCRVGNILGLEEAFYMFPISYYKTPDETSVAAERTNEKTSD